jgi:hypothetical protein
MSDNTPRTKIYAELILPVPLDIPPLKLLINQQIVSTTSDSLKNSEAIAHNLAKSLILDYLTTNNRDNFGGIIRKILDFEYTRQSSRSLAFWSLQLPSVYSNIRSTFISSILYNLDGKTFDPTVNYNVLSLIQNSGTVTLGQGIIFTLKHPEYSIYPMVKVAVHSLPFQKV